MSLTTWIRSIFSNGKITDVPVDEFTFFNLAAESYIRELAFQSAVSLIANSISKCEFKTYLKNKESKEREYYLFNVEPNENQNSSQFIHKLINKLYSNNECLVIEANGQLLVADSFCKDEFALYGYNFTQVTVDNLTFEKTFSMREVLYLKLKNENIRTLLNGMYENYGKLIAYAQKSYRKSRGHRGILDVDSVAEGKLNFKEVFQKLMDERFKTFFENDNAVLPLFNGYKYTELTSKTYSQEGTRDIKAMIDDIYDFTARAFCMPPVLLKGDLANNEQAVDNFLTFCIDPLCDMVQEEINRKRNRYEGFKQGTYLKIDTKTIKHVDLFGISAAVDKLVSSGAFCINDIRKAAGEEPINETWANEHFITKNYSNIEEYINTLKGGEKQQ